MARLRELEDVEARGEGKGEGLGENESILMTMHGCFGDEERIFVATLSGCVATQDFPMP